jgi:hypothetical protein
MRVENEVVIFDLIGDDEELFATWLTNNRSGYVANIGRGANRFSPVKLHTAQCTFMNSERVAKGGFINQDFYKVCSLDGQTLVRWVQAGHQAGQWGEPSDDRRHCHPALIPQEPNH